MDEKKELESRKKEAGKQSEESFSEAELKAHVLALFTKEFALNEEAEKLQKKLMDNDEKLRRGKLTVAEIEKINENQVYWEKKKQFLKTMQDEFMQQKDQLWNKVALHFEDLEKAWALFEQAEEEVWLKHEAQPPVQA